MPSPSVLLHPIRLASFIALVAFLSACVSQPQRDPVVKPTESFDAAWTIVRDQHFDAGLNGVDWNAVRDELRPKAARARSNAELRAVIDDMLSRLGQSHFAIMPGAAEVSDRAAVAVAAPDAAAVAAARANDDGGLDGVAPAAASAPSGAASANTDGGPGIAGVEIALVDGKPTVLRVSPELGGARAGVLMGWQLVSVDGMLVDDAMAEPRRALEAAREASDSKDSPEIRRLRGELEFIGGSLLQGDAGESRRVVFRDASGAERAVDIVLAAAPLGSTKFGNLPAFPIDVFSRVIEVPVDGGKPVRIGFLAFNIWMTGASDAIDRAVDSLRDCDGMVIDLRGNPGGLGAMSMGVAGHFVRETASLGTMTGRDSRLEFTASPRKVSADGKRVRPYGTKPLAILVDGRSASTSEVFAGGLQDLGRARVFGENSAGMALPAHASRLPNGDVLLYAVADFVTSKGTRLEGRGVIPDEPVATTRAALLKGNDAVLDAASGWIARSTIEVRAARVNPQPSGDATILPGSMPSAMPTVIPPVTP